MLRVNNLIGFGRYNTLTPQDSDLIEFTGDASTTGSNPSFAGMSFGDEPAGGDTRHIIVAIASLGSGGVAAGNASMTIGGVSATLLFRSLTFRNVCCEIWIAEVPTGTTGTVAVTTVYSSAHSIAVYRGINLAAATPMDSDGGYSTTTDFSVPIDVLDGGAIIAVYGANTSLVESARDIGNIEEDAANLGPGTWQAIHASMNSDSDQTVALTVTRGNATHAIAAVSFQGPPVIEFDLSFIEGKLGEENSDGDITFSGVNFGAEDPDRYIIVSLTGIATSGFNRDYTSVTIGGVAATRALRAFEGQTNSNAEIWIAAVPTGTTGNIVTVSQAANGFICQSLAVYRVVGLSSTTPTDTAVGTTSAAGLTISPGGFAIAVGVDNNVNDLDLTNVNVDYEVSGTLTAHRGTHGSLADGVAQTITITHTNGTRIAAASFL